MLRVLLGGSSLGLLGGGGLDRGGRGRGGSRVVLLGASGGHFGRSWLSAVVGWVCSGGAEDIE